MISLRIKNQIVPRLLALAILAPLGACASSNFDDDETPLGDKNIIVPASKNKASGEADAAPNRLTIPMSETSEGETQAPPTRKRKKSKKLSKSKLKSKVMTSTEQASTPAATPNAVTVTIPAPMAVPVAQVTPAQQAACVNIFNRVLPPYQKLAAKRPKTIPLTGTPLSTLDLMLQLKIEDCSSFQKRPEALKIFAAAVSEHSQRIGVILPISGSRARQSQLILNGMRSAFQDAGLKFEERVIVKDSRGEASTTEAALAELVFHDKISLVLGGLEDAETNILLSYADPLMLPTLLLAREREQVATSKHAFRIFPDQKDLATTLVNAALNEQHKRIVILRPSNHKSDKIASYFTAALTAAGGKVVTDLQYTPNDFESMQGVGRQLFRIDTVERAEEYRAAYQKAKLEAKTLKQPFDPRLVVLKPIIDFDAVFIPDDFRTVRHFAKLFRFYGMTRLPLIGNHEWRSTALIEPYDDFLEGSIFADFIGSYTQLPPAISAPTLNSPYFVSPEHVATVDFQLIGYRIAHLSTLALKEPTIKRRHIAQAILKEQSDGRRQFLPGPYFTADHNSNWPTYIFRVRDGQLMLEKAPQPPAASKSPERSANASGSHQLL